MTSLVLAAGAARAASSIALLELDPAKTHVNFTLNTTVHTVHGSFQLKRGTIWLDPATGSAQGALVVDADSGQSGDGLRDARMRSSILETSHFPEVTFIPQQVQFLGPPQGDFRARLRGLMRLHGTSHPMTIELLVHNERDLISAKTRFVIPYVAWGLEDPSVLFLKVSPAVTIDVQAHGQVRWQARGPAAHKVLLYDSSSP
ncbi:MAG TPA: YceI family protein [Candidatus Binataceae bacterium]|nr:YceI family protein [Candidatus Binataceae bacterium]